MATAKTDKYYLNGELVLDYINSNGILTERDYLNGANQAIEKDYYTNGIVVEKDSLTNNAVTEKDYYTGGTTLTEKDSLTNGKITAKALYTNGIVVEKDSLNNNVVTEKDYYTGGKVTLKDICTNGTVTEQDYLATDGTVTEKILLTSTGKTAEKDFYSDVKGVGVLNEQDFYTNGALAKINYYTNGTLSIQEYLANNQLTEVDYLKNGNVAIKDFYTNGIATEIDTLTNGLVTEKDYLTKGTVTEKDYLTNGNVSEKDFLTNGSITEKDYLTKGTVTEKDYYTNGVLTGKTYSNGNTTSIVTTDPSGQTVIDYGQNNYWANSLDYAQGDNNKKYMSDCGLASCENVLIESGVLAKRVNYNPVWGSATDTEESTVVDYAAANGLCVTSNSNAYNDGGTYGSWQAQILQHFGVNAVDENITLNQLAASIKNGFDAIAEVSAEILWGTGTTNYADHAITITGVAYDYNNPNQVDGFYICDSGRWLKSDADRFVSYSLMSQAFDMNAVGNVAYGEAVVTTNTQAASVSSSGSKVGTAEVNNIIHQMAAFSSNSSAQVSIAANNPPQTL